MNKPLVCALSLYQATADDHYLDIVHRFIEKSKATLLAEALQGNKLVQVQGVPDSLLKQEVDLKHRISFVESSLASASEASEDSLENLLFELRRTYDGLGQNLAQNYPRYYDLKYQVEVASPKEIQAQLDEHTAVTQLFFRRSPTGMPLPLVKIKSTCIRSILLYLRILV